MIAVFGCGLGVPVRIALDDGVVGVDGSGKARALGALLGFCAFAAVVISAAYIAWVRRSAAVTCGLIVCTIVLSSGPILVDESGEETLVGARLWWGILAAFFGLVGYGIRLWQWSRDAACDRHTAASEKGTASWAVALSRAINALRLDSARVPPTMVSMPSARTVMSFLIGLLLMAANAAATWSIVVVDLVTGEVAVGIATCLTGFDLRPNTVVIVPGRGAAAAQSFVGPLSLRQLIRDGFLTGDSANQILQALANADGGHQSRQYGIVSLTGGEATFTGSGAGAWAGGVVGQSGNLRYAIQGNILTGQPVVTAAEQALVTTPGGLPDKLMAAMEAARAMGGDGRCSCSQFSPTACGSPPPSFNKSSHIALMIVSRPSDVDAPCGAALGCGAGDYWLDLNVANQPASAPDPVLTLQGLFQTWKQSQVGRPDHYASTATITNSVIRANGLDEAVVNVELRDAQNNPLGNSLPLDVQLSADSTVADVVFSPVSALPDGTYEFTVRGALRAGTAALDISVTDTRGRVGIWPRPVVTLEDMFGACGAGAVPDGQGGALTALKVNGSGGVDRVVEVGFSQPFSLTLSAPVVSTPAFPVGMFALWAHAGIPAAGATLPLGAAPNALCFTPSPLLAGAPTALVADSFGLGSPVFAAPAPFTLSVPGLPVLLDAVLQGAVVVDAQGTFAATNAVFLRIQSLPPPVITSVSPFAPAAGQLVTVAGSAFAPGIAAAIDGVLVPLTYISPSLVSFTMPAGASCDATLVLGNPGGSSDATPLNGSPTITNLPFSSGPAAGGNTFIVIGQNLAGCTVTVGGSPLVPIAQTAVSIVGSAPPGSPGPAAVVITSPSGCQTTGTYTYQ